MGLERGPPSPQHTANTQRAALGPTPPPHQRSPCLQHCRLDEFTSSAHDLLRTRRSALRPERARREVGGGWREPAERLGLERGPPSPQHSADTSHSAFVLQLRRTEREYGLSLLANSEVRRSRWVGRTRAFAEGHANSRSDWDVAERRLLSLVNLVHPEFVSPSEGQPTISMPHLRLRASAVSIRQPSVISVNVE